MYFLTLRREFTILGICGISAWHMCLALSTTLSAKFTFSNLVSQSNLAPFTVCLPLGILFCEENQGSWTILAETGIDFFAFLQRAIACSSLSLTPPQEIGWPS